MRIILKLAPLIMLSRIRRGLFVFVVAVGMSLLAVNAQGDGGTLPIANAGEAAKYIGEIYSYAETPGFAFSDKKSREIGREYLLGLIISNRHGHVIFLLAENAMDKSKEGIVYDAIDIPKGQSLIGSLEEECKAKKHPNETIFVIGKWVNRKTPNGEFAGGYAHQITKAWRVNFEKKKLEEIPTAGIKCEDNRTDADVN